MGYYKWNNKYVFDIEAVKQIKELAKDNPRLEVFNQFARGHIPKYKRKELAKEFTYVLKHKDEDKSLHNDVYKLCNYLIENGNNIENIVIGKDDIDYFMTLGDTWMLPSQLFGYVDVSGLKELYNLEYDYEELYELFDDKLYYDVLRDYGVIPNLSDDDGLLSFSKSRFERRWRNVVDYNKKVTSSLVEGICDDAMRSMSKNEYDAKFTVHCCYIKYTPSKEVIDQVIEIIKEHMDEELLKDLVMIFWPSQYKGYQIDREVFKNEDYAFTNKKIVINFEDLSVSYEDLQKDDFKVFL